jgi:hypothetical protein
VTRILIKLTLVPAIADWFEEFLDISRTKTGIVLQIGQVLIAIQTNG